MSLDIISFVEVFVRDRQPGEVAMGATKEAPANQGVERDGTSRYSQF